MHVSEKSFNLIRDRVTADDIIGTKFLPLSEISGNGDAGMFQDIIFHLLSFVQTFIYDGVSLHPPEIILFNSSLCMLFVTTYPKFSLTNR